MRCISILFIASVYICLTPCNAAERVYSLDDIVAISTRTKERTRLCGPLALFKVLSQDSEEMRFEELMKDFSVDEERGVAIGAIIDVATKHGSQARAVTYVEQDLTTVPPFSILVVDRDSHCVVLESVDPTIQKVTLWDPASFKTSEIPTEILATRWNGTAILIGGENRLAALEIAMICSAAVFTFLLLRTVASRRTSYCRSRRESVSGG